MFQMILKSTDFNTSESCQNVSMVTDSVWQAFKNVRCQGGHLNVNRLVNAGKTWTYSSKKS